MKLIDKSALVAEIERLKNTSLEYGYNTMQKVLADSGKDLSLGQLQYFLDTLEVKEVDIEKEIEEWEKSFKTKPSSMGYKETAKHFYELGVSCPINNINIEEVKAAAKAWSEDDENTGSCDYIGAAVAERAFVACAEWLINKTQK